MTTIQLELEKRSYDITVGKGALNLASSVMNLDRRVFILTDSGVPKEYSEKIKSCSKEAVIYTVNEGEDSKSLTVLEDVLKAMLEFGLTRSDCAVAVGGGVVGDLTGFAASIYMRGIDFYNVPTTLLSQVDSSIGGKTAVNLGGVKNIVGSFYQPRHVLIDTETLKTLPERLISAGLAESVKMACTCSSELFELIENEPLTEDVLENIIIESLNIKRIVVEADETEKGVRKILNFGHTLGHGIEAVSQESEAPLYHGECVALGMIPMCSPEVRERLVPVLKKLNLPYILPNELNKALELVTHDKKCSGGSLEVIFVEKLGTFEIKKTTPDEFKTMILKERSTI